MTGTLSATSNATTRGDSLQASNLEKRWIHTWETIAEEEGFSPDLISFVSARLHESLAKAEECAELDGTEIEPYERSLRNFVKMYHGQLSDLQTRNGISYWLAFCAGDAAQRLCHSSPSTNDIEEYSTLVSIVTEELRGRIVSQLTQDDLAVLLPTIDAEVHGFSRNMETLIRSYREDVLYPGFRRRSEAALEQIRTRLSTTPVPRYMEPVEMMVSKQRAYENQLTAYIRNILWGCLCDHLIFELRPRFRQNEYWGHMRWSAESTRAPRSFDASTLRWPAIVHLRPDDSRNKQNSTTLQQVQ